MPRKIDTAVIEYVPDFSQFTRTVDRQLQRSFEGVERVAERSAEDIEDSFNELERDINEVFDEIRRSGTVDMTALTDVANRTAETVAREFEQGGEEAENAFAELRRTANRELDRIDTNVAVTTTAAGHRFGAFALTAGAAMIGIGAAATIGLGAIAGFGLVSAAQFEQVQISFNALLGSAEEGERVFRSLQDFAATTPFEFAGVANVAKRFLTFNEAVGLADDQLIDFLTTVGDIASVTGAGAEGMNRIAFALGQIASRGRVQLEEINQISEAIPGFSALAAIAEHFGITTAEAMEKISDGAVSAEEGVAAIIAGMQKFPGAAGAMEDQAQTLLGVFSTFKDTIAITLADAFAPVIPDIKAALTEATPIIGDALKELAPVIGELIAIIAPLLSGLIDLIVPVLVPILEALGPALEELAPAMGPLGEALGEVIIALIPLLPLLTELLILAAEVAVPILELLVPALELLAPIISTVTTGLEAFNKLINGEDISDMAAEIDGPFFEAFKAIADFFTNTIPEAWNSVVEFFKAVPGQIWNFIKSIPSLIAKAFTMAFDLAFKAIGIGIGLVYVAVTRLPGLIIDAVTALPGMLHTFFTNLWTDAKDTTERVGNGIWAWVKALPGRITSALQALPGVVSNFFRTAFENAKNIAATAITNIVDFVRNLPSRIASFAMDVASGITNFIRGAINRAIDSVNSGIAQVDAVIPGSLPRIPRLAHGGIAFSPAIIGEDSRTTPEAAIPLGDSRAMAMLVDAFSSAQGNGSSTNVANNFTVIVEIDGQQLEGRVVSVMDERDRRLKQRVMSRRGF